MINKDVLYLKKANRSTIIKYKNQDEIVINLLLEKLLDFALREDLTTLKGRLEATSKVYRIFKHVPIYLKETIIIFIDHSFLKIDKPYHLMKKYYDLSLKIKKL